MAVHLATSSDYLKRTTALLPASGDSTVAFWVRLPVIATGANTQVPYAIADTLGIYTTNYVATFLNDSVTELEVNGNDIDGATIGNNTWAYLTWTQSGTTQRWYINGTSIGTHTVNRAAVTDVIELLGSDTIGALGDVDLAYCREWTAALSQEAILTEMSSPVAVTTAGLWMDCPLATDAIDISGQGHSWTTIGSVTYVTGPTQASNSTAETAADITSLPYSLTVDYGSGVTGWWKYTGHAEEVLAGFWGFSNLSDSLETFVYTDPFTLPRVQYLDIISNQNRPIQVPQVEAQTLYFLVLATGGIPPTDPVVFSALPGPTSPVPVGSICINDDTVGFPLAFLSVDTGQPLSFQVFPASERGAPKTNTTVLPSGITLTDDIDANVFRLYTADLQTQLTTIPFPFSGTPEAMNSDQDATFYVSGWPTGGNSQITTISDAGVVGGTAWTVSGHAFTLAPTLDNTLLYYADGSSGAAIKTWDLNTDMAGSDFAAGVSGYQIKDMLNLADGTFAVGYKRTADSFVRIYGADGSTVADYASFGGATNVNHLCQAIDDPNSIWVWLYEVSGTTLTGNSRIVNLKVSDGSFLTDLTGLAQYENGAYSPEASADPQRFGHSNSCPLWILRGAVTPPIPVGDPVEYLIRRERWWPHISHEEKRQTFGKLQVILYAGNGLTAGPVDDPVQGEDPIMEVDWSDDGGHTWSNIHFIHTGKIGAYKTRAMLRRMGQSRDRVYRIAVSDPVQWSVISADLDATLGTS